MPKITKARGATSQLDGSHLLQESGAEKEPEATAASSAPPAELERPNVKAKVAAWAAYAKQLGVDTEDADGKALTKKQLIKAVDAAEAE